MEEIVTRLVERRFPELTGGYHLPRFARVIGVADPPAGNGLCDEFRPRFAADLEVLAPDGEPDSDIPPFLGVPLPMPNGGGERGFLGFPEVGTLVVLAFAYGLPSKPFIMQILPHGQSLPQVTTEEQLWQHSETSMQRVDADGSWSRTTDSRISDRSTDREIEAQLNREIYQTHSHQVALHSSEQVGGVKNLQVMGALKILSGGSTALATVDDLQLATGRDLNLVVGQRYNGIIAGNMVEVIQGIRQSITTLSQRFQAPTTWLGSADVNVLQILCDLLDLVEQMNTQLAGHTHAPGAPPGNSGNFSDNAGKASQLGDRLKSITG